MTSSASITLSTILIFLSVVIFVNWLIVKAGDLDGATYIFGHSLDDVGYDGEGFYVIPILITGIIGKYSLCCTRSFDDMTNHSTDYSPLLQVLATVLESMMATLRVKGCL